MKTKAFVFAAIAACLTSSAFAQSYEYREHAGVRYEDRYEHHDRYERDDRYERRARDDRYYRNGYERRDSYHRPYRQRMEGAGPYQDLYRGSRLPQAFWGRHHKVYNWQRFGLRAPWRGHNWVRVGNDYAMVNVSTGLISRVVVR